MQITRRDALMGATAAAVVTGAITAPLALKAAGVKAALAGDTVLLARIGQFHDVYGEWQRVWAKHKAHRAAVESMADCPGFGGTMELNKPRFDFLEANDAYRGWDEASELCSRMGALAKTIFETPAESAKGALEKLKIAYTAVGDGEGTATGDNDLEAFQDLEAPWMEAVIADFERLSGGLPS